MTNWRIRLPIQTAIYSVAIGTYTAALVIYLTTRADISSARVGVVLTTGGAAAVVASGLTGRMIDRLGSRRVWSACAAIDAVTFILLAFSQGMVEVTLVYVLISSSAAVGNSSRVTYTYNAVPENIRRNVQARVRVTLFGGLAAGALLAGVLTSTLSAPQLWLVPAFTSLLFAVSCIYIRFLPELAVTSARGNSHRLRWRQERGFLVATSTLAVIGINEILLTVIFPLWLLSFHQTPKYVVSVMLIVNTAMVVLLQVRVSNLMTRRSVFASVGWGTALVAASIVLLIPFGELENAAAIAVYAAAVSVVYSFGHMIYSAACWDVFARITTAERRGEYQGMFQMLAQSALAVAPVAMAALVNSGKFGVAAMAIFFFGISPVSALMLKRSVASVDQKKDAISKGASSCA